MGRTSSSIKLAALRKFSRQPVLLKAQLTTGSYEFDCIAYDLSLTGMMLKLDLPLATNCEVHVMVRENPPLPARVVWADGGYVGLEFKPAPDQVVKILGSIGDKLPRA